MKTYSVQIFIGRSNQRNILRYEAIRANSPEEASEEMRRKVLFELRREEKSITKVECRTLFEQINNEE